MSKIKNILVIDDDRIYHFILRKLFAKSSNNIFTLFTENGQEGIERLKESITRNCLPDLILLDINMPIMNGWQFLDEFSLLKKQYQFQVPIYLISSSNNNEDSMTAKRYSDHIKEYITKPIDDLDINKILL